MKILHTADIHLGVKNGKLEKVKQTLLKDEAIYNTRKLFDFAEQEDYDVVLVCGDLFNSKSIESKFSKTFFDAVRGYSRPVICISGNHDESFILPPVVPANFVFLDKKNPSFSYGDTNFYSEEYISIENNLSNNILLLHGNIENTRDSDFIDINKFLNKGFNYIALGHVHQFKKYEIGKDLLAYPGCLFSNGFDEGGEKGFITFEIENKEVKNHRFVPFQARKFVVSEVDISNLLTNRQIIDKIEEELKNTNVNYQDLLKVVLKGAVSEDCEKSLPFILGKFDNYFHFEMQDKTSLKINIEKIKNEKLSLKYEFLSLLENSQLDNESKRLICEIGLEALKGEDLNI